jgi:hypothetical protein
LLLEVHTEINEDYHNKLQCCLKDQATKGHILICNNNIALAKRREIVTLFFQYWTQISLIYYTYTHTLGVHMFIPWQFIPQAYLIPKVNHKK